MPTDIQDCLRKRRFVIVDINAEPRNTVFFAWTLNDEAVGRTVGIRFVKCSLSDKLDGDGGMIRLAHPATMENIVCVAN